MAGFDYARMEQTANRLIERFGKDATLVKQTQSGPDHDPVITETTHTVRIAEVGYSLTNRDATLIQVGDKVGIVSTAGKAPEFEDKLKIGGERYNLVDLQPLNPGGTVVFYEFVGRA